MTAERLPLTEAELIPPSDADVARALAEFAQAVRRHYGTTLMGLFLFGSRARGDNRPDSDADVAVVLADGDWVDWEERRTLSRLAFEPTLEIGLLIQPWPVQASNWSREASQPAFVRSAQRDGVSIGAL